MAQCVTFAQASPRQISQALLSVQDELEEMFHPLSWQTWANAFLTLQPDLWVAQETVYLDEQGLARMAKHLATLPGAADLECLKHGPRVVYLAKKLVNYQDDAIYALTDIEAQPSAYGPAVYQLVTGLARGNAVAHEVYRATSAGPHGRPGGSDPELARAAVLGRLQALGRARGVLGYA